VFLWDRLGQGQHLLVHLAAGDDQHIKTCLPWVPISSKCLKTARSERGAVPVKRPGLVGQDRGRQAHPRSDVRAG